MDGWLSMLDHVIYDPIHFHIPRWIHRFEDQRRSLIATTVLTVQLEGAVEIFHKIVVFIIVVIVSESFTFL